MADETRPDGHPTEEAPATAQAVDQSTPRPAEESDVVDAVPPESSQPHLVDEGVQTTGRKDSTASSIAPVIIRDLDAISASESELLNKLKAQIDDLTSQVTSLNGKLVQSYNRVGGLEDEIEKKTHDSKELQNKVRTLEEQRKEWEDKYEGGLLVEKDHVQRELSSMMDRVIEETASRGKAETARNNIEQELESLSQQLFQEANTMVAEERVKRLRSERKMEELEGNLKDTQEMMSHQSEQMKGLGSQVDELEKERDELRRQIEETNEELSSLNSSGISLADSSTSEVSSTSAASAHSAHTATFPDNQMLSFPLPSTPGGSSRSLPPVLPAHPLQFIDFDLLPFQEFVVFTKYMARLRRSLQARPTSYESQGYGGYAAAYGAAHAAHAYSERSHQMDVRDAIAQALPLSQYLGFNFLKRLQDEDMDPSLRLDNAPGLTFFSKRSLSTSIVDGNIIIEPAHTTIPSDKCSLCGTSLEKFIASHQSHLPREDPRKKLTRLATGWIPGQGGNKDNSGSGYASGTATPTKAQDFSWSISGLSEALQGALTPSREMSGFNFGSFTGNPSIVGANGNGASRPTSSAGPRPSSGLQHQHSFSQSSTQSQPYRKERQMSSSSSTSAHSDVSSASASTAASTDSRNGQNPPSTAFSLTTTARTQGQIYLFRALDSDTKYTLCPTYCLPRLRATCELWTYVRTIEKGLLCEDSPKFFAGPPVNNVKMGEAAASSLPVHPLAGFAQRKLSAGTAAMQLSGATSAAAIIRNIGTPQISSSGHIEKQLGYGMDFSKNGIMRDNQGSNTPKLAAVDNSNTDQTDNGLGLDIEAKDFAFEAKDASPADSTSSAPTSSTSSSSPANAAEGTSTASNTSSGLPEQASMSGASDKETSAPALASQPMEQSASTTSSQGDFKLHLPPSRPKRNVARGTATPTNGSTPMTTPTPSSDGAPTASSTSSTSAETDASHVEATPTQSPVMNVEEPTPRKTEPASAATAPAATAAPPSLPARTPSNAGLTSLTSAPGAMGPPRLPNRPHLGRLGTSQSNLGLGQAGPASPRTLSRKPSFDQGGMVSTKSPDWQARCWVEIVRLKSAVFWARAGSSYFQHVNQ